MLVASTPETTNPVSTQCEIEEVPCISTVAPWQPWFIGRQANPGGGPPAWKPFNYTYHFFWGLEDVIAVFTNMWGQVPTNKSVGGLFPNDGDGNAWGDKVVGFPPVLDKLGYKLTDPGRYQNLTDDFSAQIARSRRRIARSSPACDPARFHDLLEPGAAARLQAEGRLDRQGDPVPGRGRGAWARRQQPVVGGLVVAEPSVQVVADRTTAKALADAYESAGKQWTQPIGFVHALFEVAVDVLKRAATGRRQGDGQGDRRDQSRHRRRPDPMERRRAAAIRRQERRQDAAGRRPVAAAQRQQVRHRHHRQPHRAGDPGRRQNGADRLSHDHARRVR
jgi:branched-chain amino acid transport system substrate-binding protein